MVEEARVGEAPQVGDEEVRDPEHLRRAVPEVEALLTGLQLRPEVGLVDYLE